MRKARLHGLNYFTKVSHPPIKRVGSNSNSNFLRKLEVLNQLIYNGK